VHAFWQEPSNIVSTASAAWSYFALLNLSEYDILIVRHNVYALNVSAGWKISSRNSSY